MNKGNIRVTCFAGPAEIFTFILEHGISREYRKIFMERGIELSIADQGDSN